MHRRGEAMTIEAILPDGRKQVISSVDRYNFKRIMNYVFQDDAVPCLPKGTLFVSLRATTLPPTRTIRTRCIGRVTAIRTVDEMAVAFANVTPISDGEYAAWAVAHKR
jgi:hypothetical protein